MASRDLTATFVERRTAALKRRGPGAGPKNRLTAGGSDDGHSLSLMEVRAVLSGIAFDRCLLLLVGEDAIWC